MIKPTVGRIVHYYPPSDRARFPKDRVLAPGEPHAAIVAAVWNDGCVNLAVIDRNGVPFNLTSVRLLQDEEQVAHPHYGYCSWMPYQKTKAAEAAAS